MKITKALIVAITAISLTLLGAFAFAHEGHDHHMKNGPHGGEIAMTGPYHFEMLVKPGEIDLYVLDAKMNILPLKGMEGTLAVKLADQTSKNVALTPAGDYFKAVADLGAQKNFIALATIKIDGKENVGRFRHSSMEHMEEHTAH